jgi:hypothetical protein
MANTLLKYIKDNYKQLELFSPSDINQKGTTYDAIKQELFRLNKNGSLAKLGRGFYYLPASDKNLLPSPIDALTKTYVKEDGKAIGFYFGDAFIPGFLGQKIPDSDHFEIMTNKATSGKKTVFLFQKRVTLRKPYFTINDENVVLNSFLSYVAYAPLPLLQQNYSLLANYIRTNHLSANDVINMIPYFPDKTFAKLLSTDLYRSLWKH